MTTIYIAWQRLNDGWVEFKVYRNDDPGFSREGLEVWLATMKAMPEVSEITKEKIGKKGVGKSCVVWKKAAKK